MPYAKQAWVDNVTPVDAARMLHLEDGVEMQVDVDSVVAAAGQLVASKLLLADAQPAFRILGTGEHQWGLGSSTAPDTYLKRLSAGILTTGGVQFQHDWGVWTIGTTAAMSSYAAYVGAEAQPRMQMTSDGKIQWGPGGATAPDTNLYRSGVNQLTTSGVFAASGVSSYGPINVVNAGAILTGVASGGDTAYRFVMDSGGGMFWGPGNALSDTNLYRGGANQLNTDDALYANSIASLTTVWISSNLFVDQSNVGSKLYFGSAIDTSLWRLATANLATNSLLCFRMNTGTDWVLASRAAAGDTSDRWAMQGDGSMQWGSGAAIRDTFLYRSAAGYLKTDGMFVVGLSLLVDQANSGQKIFFGSALDTNLYRWPTSPGYLKTDGNMLVAKGLWVNHDDGAGNKINFGSAGDTNLYRAGAASLAVTGTLYVPSVDPANVTSRSGLQLNFYGIKIAYLEIGAADSGGSGYRMVRVLN